MSGANHASPESSAVIKTSIRQGPDNPWLTFALVAVGTFMIMLDASIVNISLPSVARTFHTPVGGAIEWVIIAYLVTIAATLLTFGRLSDMVGRKPIWLAGLALFTVGSGVCGAANSLPLLIAARAFQGLGGALLLSTNVAIITDTFSADKRGFALGCNVVVIALGSSLGPTLGGIITEHWSWRLIFYVNLPIGICGFVMSYQALRQTISSVRQKFDPFGAALLAAGYHFANLWFAAGEQNWPLADYYLRVTRSHLKWAVRIHPVRKISSGAEVDLNGILQAVDNGYLTPLAKAIEKKDSAGFETAYRQTLEGCYACHTACEKPYLRLQIPGAASVTIINFNPHDTSKN